MSKPATLRLVPAVVVDPPKQAVPDYQRRQDETVRALLMVLGLKEVPDAATTDDPRDMFS